MAFMFKGPAALTGSSTADDLAATGAVTVGTTLAVTGASTLSNTLAVTGVSTLTGGATLGAALAMGTFKITGLGTPMDGTDAVTKTYADGLGGGALSADVTSNAAIALAPNTTYFIDSTAATAFTISEGTLAAGSLVRFVIVSGSASVAITGAAGLGSGSDLVPMSGTAGGTLTLVGVGHSAQFVFKSNKLYVVSGGGTIS